MLHIPRKYGHFVFGVIQAGLTTAIAAGLASITLFGTIAFVENWLGSWLIAWMTTIPVVLLAAPGIQRLVVAVTIEPGDSERRPARAFGSAEGRPESSPETGTWGT